MKKLTLACIAIALSSNIFAGSNCEIVVHEKTPDCYVQQDKDGCLKIGNEKPKCDDKGQCIAKLPGCNDTTNY